MAQPHSVSFSRPSWAEIDLSALRANARLLSTAHGRKTPLIAVVKANAYGHGAVEVARALIADSEIALPSLAVASVDEGIALREADVQTPILLLSAILPEEAAAAVEYDLTATIGTLAVAAALDNESRRQNKTATAHWKIDTGMGRLGTWHEEAPAMWQKLCEYSQLEITGIYTHFPCADEPGENGLAIQTERFQQALAASELPATKFLLHAANSAAAWSTRTAHFDAIRPGIALYGASPFGVQKCNQPPLEPVMNLHAKVSEVRTIAKGSTVSYGATWSAVRESQLALIPIGYADGYPRLLSNCGEVLLRGKRYPVAGRVTMDQILVDVTELSPGAQAGEVATIWGKDSSGIRLPVEEIAAKSGTIAYEVLTGVAARVPRVYRNSLT